MIDENDFDEEYSDEERARLYKKFIDLLSEHDAKFFLCKFFALRPSPKSYEDIARLSKEISVYIFNQQGWDTSKISSEQSQTLDTSGE